MPKLSIPVIIALITAAAIIGTALLTAGTEYENSWLLVFGVGSVASAIFELYSHRKKSKR